MKKFEGPIILFVLVAAVTIALAAQDKEHGGKPFKFNLTGAAEVPGPGDPDGTGTFSVTLNPGQNQVCYELSVANIAAPTAAHIHSGAVDKAGPVVLTLKTPTLTETAKDCGALDHEKVKAIMKNPEDYYVNVHNAEFPDGAVRGQFKKK
jgi:CHRD domain